MATLRKSGQQDVHVPRVVSFIVLLAIILLVGIVFFRVMAQFIVPLFLACVLLVVFQPLYQRLLKWMPRFPRVAALLTTISVVLIVLLPTLWLGWNASYELQKLLQPSASGEKPVFAEKLEEVAHMIGAKYQEYTEDLQTMVGEDRNESVALPTDVTPRRGATSPAKAIQSSDESPPTNAKQSPPLQIEVSEWVERGTSLLGPWVLSGLQVVLGLMIGLVIMLIALYYFLVDGPAMINGLMQLTPLDQRYEYELLVRFAEISRSVVLATMLSAIAQGLLAGIGYYIALPSTAPVFLLTAATMLFAIVPFIGAAGVWVPVCLVLLATGGDGGAGSNWPSVLALAIYCVIVVSGVDNIVKPYILHGQSNLHPLLALLSILGGVTVLGPVGILVGPMLVSFLQALLSMFRRELERWEDPTRKSTVTLSPGAQALADHIEAAVEGLESDLEEEKKSANSKSSKSVKPNSPKKKDR
jgi:predicted PurR-regulated permease PerM